MAAHAGTPMARDPIAEYRRLASALAYRAARLGSRDPEAAAQEALRRSLENAKSRPAIAYYFGEQTPDAGAPDWRLDQLLAWLNGVLQFVVREERSRAGFQREVPAVRASEPADASPGVLDRMLQREKRAIMADCFATLEPGHRNVLALRMDGLKYDEIARRMGLNENTVATWVSRGVRELGRRIRRRTDGRHE